MPQPSTYSREHRHPDLHLHGTLRRRRDVLEAYADYLQRVGALPEWEPRRWPPDMHADYAWNLDTGRYERKDRRLDSTDSDH